MGNVIYDISMSLDGFITAANVRPEAGLGDGGERLHDWAFNSPDPRNRELLAKGASLGAIISGRHTYDLSVPGWNAVGRDGGVIGHPTIRRFSCLPITPVSPLLWMAAPPSTSSPMAFTRR